MIQYAADFLIANFTALLSFPAPLARFRDFFQPSGMFVPDGCPGTHLLYHDHAPALQASDSGRRQRRARFQGKKNRPEGGTKRNTVTLAFIAVSRSRRPVLIIEKIATTTSVSGENAFSYRITSAGTAEPGPDSPGFCP
ncbi:hypothetical protein AFL22_06575 [Pantoea sp. CFSAN033090]|nr:hypothetical protein AFL22_06575 [Pantoea sp. CFSAN033090]